MRDLKNISAFLLVGMLLLLGGSDSKSSADEANNVANSAAAPKQVTLSFTNDTFIGDSEQILAASGDGTVHLHRTTSDNDILTYAGSKGYQHAVAATPDGRTAIAIGSDCTMRIWPGHSQEPKQVYVP